MPSWMPMLPPQEPIDPYYRCSNLHLSYIELGVGFVTVWGKGDITSEKLQSAIKFRDWYSQVWPRLPEDIRRFQGIIGKYATVPKAYENFDFFHHKDHYDPENLDHFHILYPHRQITPADIFQLRLILNNLGWVMPIIFKDYINDCLKGGIDKGKVYVELEDKWLEIMEDKDLD